MDKLPVPLETPNIDGLRNAIQEYIEDILTDDYNPDNDMDHWIYEAAMEAFYGPDIWSWINEMGDKAWERILK